MKIIPLPKPPDISKWAKGAIEGAIRMHIEGLAKLMIAMGELRKEEKIEIDGVEYDVKIEGRVTPGSKFDNKHSDW